MEFTQHSLLTQLAYSFETKIYKEFAGVSMALLKRMLYNIAQQNS